MRLASDDWAYHNDSRTLTIQVTAVRAEISNWYGGAWVWIEGYEIEWPGADPPGQWMVALVRCSAIPDEADCHHADGDSRELRQV